MHFFNQITKATFIARPNRFIVECTVNKRPVRAYLPNPGRLWELFFPGSVLYLSENRSKKPCRTGHTVIAVERDGVPIMLHTHVNNLVARKLIEEKQIPGLENCTIIKPEVSFGASRFDFLLNNGGKELVLEVKSCTLAGNSIAMFPDAMTERGTKHLLELAHLVKRGREAAVLFVVHCAKVKSFMPEWHTDLNLAEALLSVRKEVMVKAVSVEWKKDLTIGNVREISIPWDLIRQETKDRGSYIVVLKAVRDRLLFIDGIGKVRIRKGYYCYVGSAEKDLSRRIERHKRLQKNCFWHIDYLRAAADFHAALPVRASDALECAIAGELRKIAGWQVPGFGSSVCGCSSHLVGMAEDPLHSRSFIGLLLYFRIDRLEKYLHAPQGCQV
jgi:sugar fermentation stimulation protein A